MSIAYFVGLIISVVLARWVRSDAVEREDRRMKVAPFGHTAWAIAVFLLWIVFLPWYLIARSRTTATPPSPS